MTRIMIIALCVTMAMAAQVFAQTGAAPQPQAPVRYVADDGGEQTPFPAFKPAAPANGDGKAAKPAPPAANGTNGKAAKNGDSGDDEGKTVCKQKFQFNLPFGRDPKCGGVKGEVEKELKVKCPPPPDKPGLCPGDYPNGNGNGNGNGKEKEEEAPEVGVSDRVWDSVQGG